MPQSATRLGRIERVIVSVSDQDRAIDFYTRTLGFELTADVPFGDGLRWVEVTPAGGETVIALADPMGGPVGLMTGISFGTDDVEALHAQLRGQGVDVDEIDRPGHPAPPMFFFRDQDANTLHVAER